MDCSVTLAQINPALGNVEGNLALHVAEIDSAREAGADLIVFPELSLTGYFLKDQTPEIAMPRDAEPLARLAELSKEISIAAGFVERSPEGRLYNSVGFFEDGRLIHVHRKVYLVTYGMFDEEREFAAGEEFVAVDSKHGRLGLLICEDFWHAASAYQYFLADCDAMFVASCAPGRGIAGGKRELSSTHTWQMLLEAQALMTQTWIGFVNRVGWEDGVFFSGGSRLFDPFGVEVSRIEGIEPGHARVKLTSRELERARVATPLRRDAKPWLLAAGLRRLNGGEER